MATALPPHLCPRCLTAVDATRAPACPQCGVELIERRRSLSPETVRTVMSVRGGRFRRPAPARAPRRV